MKFVQIKKNVEATDKHKSTHVSLNWRADRGLGTVVIVWPNNIRNVKFYIRKNYCFSCQWILASFPDLVIMIYIYIYIYLLSCCRSPGVYTVCSLVSRPSHSLRKTTCMYEQALCFEKVQTHPSDVKLTTTFCFLLDINKICI